MMRRIVAALSSTALLSLILVAGCGGSADASANESGSTAASGPGGTPTAGAELTEVELEQGIGPIRDMGELPPIDDALAMTGEQSFTLFCSACHKFPERYIGPELGEVLTRRRPEFVMNMMLNANEMVLRHPVVKELLAEYYTPMAQQNVTEADARAILEYIRKNQNAQS